MSWRPLLLQQLLVIVLVSIALGVFNSDADFTVRTVGVSAIVLVSLLSFITILSGLPASGGNNINGAGYPFAGDFVLPLSIHGLLLPQLLFNAALVTAAYALPLFLLSEMFAIDGPQLLIALLIAGGVLLIQSLRWWTTQLVAHTTGWALILFLCWQGTLFPSLTITGDPFVVSLDSTSSGLSFIALIVACIGIQFAGVYRQRHGEDLIIRRQQSFFSRDNFTLGRLLPFLTSVCPVTSPLKAELWKQQQKHGLHVAIVIGVLGAVALLILLRVIMITRAENLHPDVLLILGFSFYLMTLMALSASSFGVNFRNRVAHISTFEMTSPISTAKMVLIRLAPATLNVITTWLLMFLIVWFIGPLLVDDFSQVKNPVLVSMGKFSSAPLFELSLITVRLLTALFTAVMLFASLGACFVLWSKLLTRLLSSLLAYGLLLLLALVLLTEQSESTAIWNWIALQHLWLFVAAMPVGLVVLVASIMKDHVLSAQQLSYGICFFSLLAGIALYSLYSGGLYSSELSLVALIATSLISLLPLTAFALGLWTMNQIRHR